MKRIDFENGTVTNNILSAALPMLVAQILNLLYNIVDRIYIARIQDVGTTALGAVGLCFPIIMIITAFSNLFGSGGAPIFSINRGKGDSRTADMIMNTAFTMLCGSAAVLMLIGFLFARPLLTLFGASDDALVYAYPYLMIYLLGTLPSMIATGMNPFINAQGYAIIGMLSVAVGAVANIILDPILIFGMFGIHKFGIAGAAIATVIGQIVAALVVMRKAFVRSPEKSCYLPHIKRIYQLGIPNILMQSAYTFYIFGLNMILAGFSDQAVTALGLYYKWQSFFFIPLGALQTCIVPVISFNYAAKDQERCKAVLKESLIAGMALMFLGTLCFEFLPVQMLSTFSKDAQVIAIGTNGFHYIGVAFIPMVTSLIFPVYFQAIGSAVKSSILTVVRTMVLFVPLGYLFSRFGLQYFWLTFPVTEVLTTLVGFKFYRSQQA